MFVALDKNEKRVYADEAIPGQELFCPYCNSPLVFKPGNGRKRPHFAHFPDSECQYSLNKDNKSPWHIRMQDYFPRESREYRFIDNETKEVHIADVYLEDTHTVLEFQHSPISETEFVSRTRFHLKNGRRIAWLFNESSKGKDSYNYGRFKRDPDGWESLAYKDRCYQWLRNPRFVLNSGPDLFDHSLQYSICVYTGTEGDVFHRIVNQFSKFHDVIFSLQNIEMCEGMDVDSFFGFDDYWKTQEPWMTWIKQFSQGSQSISYVQPVPIYRFSYGLPRRRRRRF